MSSTQTTKEGTNSRSNERACGAELKVVATEDSRLVSEHTTSGSEAGETGAGKTLTDPSD